MKQFENLLKTWVKLLLESEFNWSQFSTSSEDDNDPVMAALNAAQQDPEGRAAIEADKQKKQDNIKGVLEANAKLLAQKGIDVTKLHRLGGGAGGVAFAIDDKKVLKITGDSDEAASSNSLKGKNIRGIINIYDAWKFPNSNLFGVVMEKIIPFGDHWDNDEIKNGIEEIVDTFGLKKMIQKFGSDWQAIWNYISKSPLLMPNTNMEMLKKSFETVVAMLNNLKSAGISDFFDIHLDNIGKRANGDIVLFDIGFSKGGAEPPVLGTTH